MATGEEMLEMLANDLLDLEKLSELENNEFFDDFAENEQPEQENSKSNQGRFVSVSEEDCNQFIRDNENRNTVYKTKSDIKIFNDWKTTIGEERELLQIPASDLDNLLARFFLGKK